MDERKEILQDTIDRLIETALQELDQKLPEAGGEAALSHISDQIRQDAQLDEQHRKLMLDYIRQLNQVTCRQCRHLYQAGTAPELVWAGEYRGAGGSLRNLYLITPYNPLNI